MRNDRYKIYDPQAYKDRKESYEIFGDEENYYKRISMRLESSRSSGNYYMLISPEFERFGLNSSPYQPRFEVRTKKYYRIDIYKQLLECLNITTRKIDNREILVPFPNNGHVSTFVNDFLDPVFLYILNTGIDKWNGDIRGIESLFIFDKVYTIPVYQVREYYFKKIVNRLFGNDIKFTSIQGSIQGHLGSVATCKFDIPELDILVAINATRESQISLYNHLFLDESNLLDFIRLDNMVLVINRSQHDLFYDIVSYDHPNENIVIYPDSAHLYHHPIPKDDVD